MKALHTPLLLLGAMLAACGGEAPQPAAEPAPTPAPPPAVKAVAFAAPILEGKLEQWKAFVNEAEAEREAWDAARAAAGLTREVVWHQATDDGDFAVVYQEAADARKVMSHFAMSSNPVDQKFVGMLGEVHGMDPSAPPPLNEMAVSCQAEDPGAGTPYALVAPIAEGKQAAADALVAELHGARRADYEASCARRGLASERVWRQGPMFVVVWETSEPDQVMPSWTASEDEFDQWYLAQVAEFMGRDPSPAPQNTLMLDWTAPDAGDDAAMDDAAMDDAGPAGDDDEGDDDEAVED